MPPWFRCLCGKRTGLGHLPCSSCSLVFARQKDSFVLSAFFSFSIRRKAGVAGRNSSSPQATRGDFGTVRQRKLGPQGRIQHDQPIVHRLFKQTMAVFSLGSSGGVLEGSPEPWHGYGRQHDMEWKASHALVLDPCKRMEMEGTPQSHGMRRVRPRPP